MAFCATHQVSQAAKGLFVVKYAASREKSVDLFGVKAPNLRKPNINSVSGLKLGVDKIMFWAFQ